MEVPRQYYTKIMKCQNILVSYMKGKNIEHHRNDLKFTRYMYFWIFIVYYLNCSPHCYIQYMACACGMSTFCPDEEPTGIKMLSVSINLWFEVSVCVFVCVCPQFPFITPETSAGRNHLIHSLHGGGHSKERCLQGICLKCTQTYSDTLEDKHVATTSVPSPQYTASIGTQAPLKRGVLLPPLG